MQVALTTLGVFHSFELARELDRRRLLHHILSPFPWKRLQREGLPRNRVRTWPWLATPYMLLPRLHMDAPPLRRWLEWNISTTLDNQALRYLDGIDVLIALSTTGLRSGQELQRRGGQWVCDRGSTHIRFQERVLLEEYARWGVHHIPHQERVSVREEQEYAAANFISVPSSFALRSFVREGVPAAKMRLMPYGVRLEQFKPAPLPPASAHASSHDEYNLLFAGQVSLRKGVPYLLQAFAALRHPHKRLRIAGALHPELRTVLDRLPRENVEFLGPVPQSELIRLMQQGHCLVLPSIEEGLALVLGQALACGCPVIATPNTGAEDLLTDGVEGFLVPPRDVPALAAAMQQLADNPQLQLQMRAAALERVQTIGGWSRYGELWAEFLAGIHRTD
jgi:glycosyltransferase involved in cell wall biosynthesis